MDHEYGLRFVILKRNRLADKFASDLIRILKFDNYLKVIDVSGNLITEYGLQSVIKLGLIPNMTLLKFDCRLNPGFTEKVAGNLACVLLKNIKKMQMTGLKIERGMLEPLLYAFKIDQNLLKAMGLQNPYEAEKGTNDEMQEMLSVLSAITTPTKKETLTLQNRWHRTSPKKSKEITLNSPQSTY